MTYGICEEAVYHVYCKTRLASRSNFIVFRIFKIGFQLGSTFDPVLFDGTVLLKLRVPRRGAVLKYQYSKGPKNSKLTSKRPC